MGFIFGNQVFPWSGVGTQAEEIQSRIEEYCHRDLTYDSDALKAFDGILQKFRKMDTPVLNLYGIPIYTPETFDPPLAISEHRLLNALGWYMKGTATRRSDIPSWTWVGWQYQRDTICRFEFSFPKKLDRTYGERSFSHVSIELEFEDGRIMTLSRFWEGLLGKSELLYVPRHLVIHGAIMDMEVSETGKISLSGADKLSFQLWGGWNKETWSSGSHRAPIRFIGFILGLRNGLRSNEEVIVLVLKETNEVNTYERVGIGHVTHLPTVKSLRAKSSWWKDEKFLDRLRSYDINCREEKIRLA
ncbi:hypothetical protein BT63DRAFT_430061 [Microthyrium microscopicum]|uniref:Heterokaryon incompatibility domain-containing protein n=1 Tax=Microthyrium microscopicum TaxID=703497 RepID=A0A6A6TXT5_9PEZI|nr:hypothetical protein BT63DRAFT_430061 [Microthyrium microscopicum]